MESIIVALITGGLAFLGTLITSMIANSKTLYRIEQFEKAQNKHNSLIERMYKVEKAIEVDEERLKYIEEDVEELKDGKA
jgi:biopolymer transport protein ExbB/TolQ